MVRILSSLIILFVFTTTFTQITTNKISSALESKIFNVSENDEILIWVYFIDKGNNTDFYLNNPELVVSEKSIKRREKVFGGSSPLTFRDIPVNTDYISKLRLNGFKVKWPSRWLNAISGTVRKEDIKQIASLPFVKKLDIVYKLKTGNLLEENQKSTAKLSNKIQQPEGLNSYNYGASYAQLQQINVPAVHDSGFTGQGITICVMDAGFSRLSHDAFLSMNIIAAWDFVNNDPNVGNENDMGEGSHGTMTLSTIGGFAPGNLIGPAFNSSYILAKTENTDSETPIEEDNWIAAMEWADSIGVDVTSTSLSYLEYDPPYPSYTWMDMDGNTAVITNGADYAAYIGIVVVNSAGNSGYNSSHNTLGAPADGDSVITAGAVNSSGTRSSFSSVGPTVDGRFKPDIMALGSGDVVASPSNDHNYTTASGTSFSCPLSAGVAALILCANPNLTPMQVREAMRNTASQSTNPDNLYGWGILNALDAIYYFPSTPTTFQISVNMFDGWNMVSVPGVNPNGQSIDIWWSGKDPAASVFKYSGGYIPITTATPTEGYWMKNAGTQIYNTGDEWPAIQAVPHDPIIANAGWNMIGGYEDSAATSGLTTTPPGLISGSVFGYSGGYVPATNLIPGYGYWIKLSGAGQINIPDGLSKGTVKAAEYFKDDWGKIVLTDATGINYTLYAVKGEVDLNQYELPPSPPEGMFDIRFESGRIAENINSSVKEIDLSGVTYPLTVKAENMDMRLMDETGKIVNLNLKKGEDVVISDATIQKLKVSSDLLPMIYSLEQNYPNPFNSNTKIKFSIAGEVQVSLAVFNILGESVKELKNEMMKPEYYEVEFDASSLASGIYLYRIKAGDFIETKKMVLIK